MDNVSIDQFSDSSHVAVGRKAVILFTADWHEACVAGGAMDQMLAALAASSSTTDTSVQFGRCDAEENPGLAERYGVTAVPTFCLINPSGEVIERIVGGNDAAAVTVAVQRLVNSDSTATTVPATVVAPSPDETLTQRLDRLIRSSEVMVFIKGTPGQPKCGFSRQVIELLEAESIPFASFDILTDEAVRQGLKTHSNWPTYPQLYVSGELIGGLDILKEMKQDGPLAEQLGVSVVTPPNSSAAAPVQVSLNDRLRQLVHRSPVMLFMKGLPSAPKCGFSRQLVQLLDDAGISYDAFDILTDEEVRLGLKAYSDWPTYPQLYVKGDLIGGLDIVKEMSEDGSLKEALLGAS